MHKKYPPHFECSGRAYIDGHEIGSLSTDIIEYANNHQLSIHFVVESARKFLGTHTDPQQCEAQANNWQRVFTAAETLS